MNLFAFLSGWRLPVAAVFLMFPAGQLPAAALRPAEISAEQATQAPYRDSGRIEVQQGRFQYIGTASYIRRYTGLTAGHILYSSKTGLSTNIFYQPALYLQTPAYTAANYFAVLAGYQQAVDRSGDDSDAAFEQDMGYLIFARPALHDEWATWSAHPADLLTGGPFLLFGYAAENFEGDVLASVRHSSPYAQEHGSALYENPAYYTEGGMSGGPVYVTLPNGTMTMAAINVAGTTYPQRADSGARAITPAEGLLLLSAEYDHGVIRGGIIKGPTIVAAGGTAKFKTGLTFGDGPQVNNTVAAHYDDDLKLVAVGPYKRVITVTKVKPGKYAVAFPASIPAGTQVPLRLLRTALPQKNQTPLQTLTVAVQ